MNDEFHTLYSNRYVTVDAKPDMKAKLEKVSYSSRYAVGLFYHKGQYLVLNYPSK